MKPKTKFPIEYEVRHTETFEIDLEELAEVIIEEFGEYKDSDSEIMVDFFGDNMEYCLTKLGFPEDVILEDYDADYIIEEIYCDLEDILNEKIKG